MKSGLAHPPQLQDIMFNLIKEFRIIWAPKYNYPMIYWIGKLLQDDILMQAPSLQT